MAQVFHASSGLYYKPVMIANDNSRVVNKLETLLTDNARVVIYDHHMFVVPATDHASKPNPKLKTHLGPVL